MKSGSPGTIYWYGAGSDVLIDTDPSNNAHAGYAYFNGQRALRILPTNEIGFYFTDHLGNTRYFQSLAGDNVSDFYPFGGERVYSGGAPTHYKFTGKERDSESGNDNFGARYNSSSLGRFMSPDPSGILSAQNTSPQSWNLYSYVQNNPVNAIDPDGLDCVYVIDNSVSVRRGDCASDTDDGVFINGTIDIHSGTYDSSTGTVGFNYTNDDNGAIGKGVIADVYPSGGGNSLFGALGLAGQIAEPGVNFAANGLRAFGYAVATPLMVAAECLAGAPSCTTGDVAMAILPELAALREGAALLRAGRGLHAAELLEKAGGLS